MVNLLKTDSTFERTNADQTKKLGTKTFKPKIENGPQYAHQDGSSSKFQSRDMDRPWAGTSSTPKPSTHDPTSNDHGGV
jgi:hypothetical protein